MGIIYLFCASNTIEKNIQYISIISSKNIKEYDEINNGSQTFVFHKLRINVNYIIYKITLPIEDSLLEKITSNVKNHDRLSIINKYGDYLLLINKEEFHLYSMRHRHRSIIVYPIVLINCQ